MTINGDHGDVTFVEERHDVDRGCAIPSVPEAGGAWRAERRCPGDEVSHVELAKEIDESASEVVVYGMAFRSLASLSLSCSILPLLFLFLFLFHFLSFFTLTCSPLLSLALSPALSLSLEAWLSVSPNIPCVTDKKGPVPLYRRGRRFGHRNNFCQLYRLSYSLTALTQGSSSKLEREPDSHQVAFSCVAARHTDKRITREDSSGSA